MKVFNVRGERILPDDSGLDTQDFLFNNAPMVELTDVQTTLEIQRLREKYFDDHAQLKKELSKRSDNPKQLAPGTLPNTYLLGSTMYSQGKSHHLTRGQKLTISGIRIWSIRSQVLDGTIQSTPERPSRPNNPINSPPNFP